MSGFPPRCDPPVGPHKRSAAGQDTRLRSGFTARWRLAPYRAYCLTEPGSCGFSRGVIPPLGPRKRSAAGRDTRLRSGFTARWRLAPYRAYCLTEPGMSGFPRGVIPPQARASAAPPGGIVGTVVAQTAAVRRFPPGKGPHPARTSSGWRRKLPAVKSPP